MVVEGLLYPDQPFVVDVGGGPYLSDTQHGYDSKSSSSPQRLGTHHALQLLQDDCTESISEEDKKALEQGQPNELTLKISTN